MATSTFTSFHYQRDYWRVQQVLRMGAIEGQEILDPQKWESVKRQGDDEIKKWINRQMSGKDAVCVLVGRETASRRWVLHEISKAWDAKKRIVGVRINGLQDSAKHTDIQGPNPFDKLTLGGIPLSTYIPLHTPTGPTSTDVYNNIRANLESWVANGYKPS